METQIREYPIVWQGGEIGRAAVEPDGLWYRLTARCREPGPGVWRLWGCFGPASRCLGIPVPERADRAQGELVLERRVSRRSCPVLPEALILGREAEGFRPWRGLVEGQAVADAMRRENADGTHTLAIFAPPEGPVPLAERVGQMEASVLDGRSCLLLDLPAEEAP